MRIEYKFHGKVKRSSTDQIEDNKIKEGPMRVFASYVDLPGLAMSRSIGDLMAKDLGVIADPEIQIFEMSSPKVIP